MHPGEQLKGTNAASDEECCKFCQHTDGSSAVGEKRGETYTGFRGLT
jgi:hypothetical protein